jgi:hypothetical protein
MIWGETNFQEHVSQNIPFLVSVPGPIEPGLRGL